MKRLAVPVEDHPIEYANFEGIVPEGEYGAGTVMIWDRGTWVPDESDVDASLRKGDLKFALRGKKLKGSWALVRTRGGFPPAGKGPAWLLMKKHDTFASAEDITLVQPRSAVSNWLLAEIAKNEGGDIAMAMTGDPRQDVSPLPEMPAPPGVGTPSVRSKRKNTS